MENKFTPNYGVILFGPWKKDEELTLGNERFREFIYMLFDDLLPSINAEVERKFSEALQVPLSLSVYSVPESDVPPRFNVMSYVGPAWLSVVLDTIPSGAILESEFSRHAGLVTLFLRVGSRNCFVCVRDFLCGETESKHVCQGDDFMTASSEMVLDFTGTLHCTVVMSAGLAKCAAERGRKCNSESIYEFLEVLGSALNNLSEQAKARYGAYRRLLKMKRNLDRRGEVKIGKFLELNPSLSQTSNA